MEGQLNDVYTVERQSVPGSNAGLMVIFTREKRLKPKGRWTDEDQRLYRETGLHPRENYDCITTTLDGGMNVTPPCPVKRIEDGHGYFDGDTGEFTDDIKRFPRQWDAYQRGLSAEDQVIGYPLRHYFQQDPAKVDHYKFFKVFTVEQLAELPQQLKQQIGIGAVEDSKKAQKFLDDARSMAPHVQSAEALNNALEKISALEKLIEDAGIKAKKKPGRPKNKEVNQDGE